MPRLPPVTSATLSRNVIVDRYFFRADTGASTPGC
jgi:hypothetical protein